MSKTRKNKSHSNRTAAPRQLIAALLRDTSPELDAVLADLHALDAASAGLLAARSRAANQHQQPAWIDEIAEVLNTEMQRCARKIEKARNAP